MQTESTRYFTEKIQLLMKVFNSDIVGVGKYRSEKYKEISEFYLRNGFPKKCSQISMSLIPSIINEAIYDSVEWSTQSADLGHMEYDFEIDCIFHNEGKRRHELTTEGFKQYLNFIHNAIQFAKNNKNN